MPGGAWIALEGGDGCGKSTQAALLAEHLDAVLTREPGGTAIGALVRGVLLDPTHDRMVDRAEALLYAADRAQHVVEVVAPALAAGRHVVSDRSAWSSVVYQGVGRGLGVERVRTLNDWAIAGRWPDIMVLLDADPAAMVGRIARPLDRLEQVDDEFRRRVREGFRALAVESPERWIVVDAVGSADAVAASVQVAVTERLGALG